MLTAHELAVAHLRARRRRRPVRAVRLPGGVFTGFRRGDHLAPGAATGRTAFEQWLSEHPHPSRGR